MKDGNWVLIYKKLKKKKIRCDAMETDDFFFPAS